MPILKVRYVFLVLIYLFLGISCWKYRLPVGTHLIKWVFLEISVRNKVPVGIFLLETFFLIVISRGTQGNHFLELTATKTGSQQKYMPKIGSSTFLKKELAEIMFPQEYFH
jgi:hypothetical protein